MAVGEVSVNVGRERKKEKEVVIKIYEVKKN